MRLVQGKTKKRKKKQKREDHIWYECPNCSKKSVEGTRTESGKRICPICIVKKSEVYELIMRRC